jgi:hypothetical protein
MRRTRSLLVAVVLALLLATPAYGAGKLQMSCPRCDHVDVEGHGLKANAHLILVIRDVRSGQEVVGETTITTDASGSFAGEYDVDLAKHPLLLASVYDRAGTDVELAAHTRAEAPAHCGRAASLPYSGAPSGRATALATGLLGAGGLLLLATRRRARSSGA